MNNDGSLTFNYEGRDDDPVGNSEVHPAPSEGIKSNREEMDVASALGDASMNDGGDCVKKVAASSAAGGRLIKEGNDRSNTDGGSTARCKCVTKYRTMSKRVACNGCGC